MNNIRDAFIAAIEEIEPILFITLVFNYPIGINAADRVLDEFFRRLERKGHGKRWAAFGNLRLQAWGFPENVRSNFHYHLAVRCDGRIARAAMAYGSDIWRRLTKTGHADIQEIIERDAVTRYITKYADDERALETYYVYTRV
jgi:hypothetical protein